MALRLGKLRPHSASSRVVLLVEQVATELAIEPDAVFSYSRKRIVAQARQAITYALYINGRMSMPQVARALGYADHTAVFYNLETCRALLRNYQHGRDTKTPIPAALEPLLRSIRVALKSSRYIWERVDIMGGEKALASRLEPSITPELMRSIEYTNGTGVEL